MQKTHLSNQAGRPCQNVELEKGTYFLPTAESRARSFKSAALLTHMCNVAENIGKTVKERLLFDVEAVSPCAGGHPVDNSVSECIADSGPTIVQQGTDCH
jgi:hypothetical protein